jgi:hypothetical protein
MKFKELLYKSSENKQIEEDVTNWKNTFIRSIELFINGYKDKDGKNHSLKDIYKPNELKLVEVMESFEDDLALIVFEYKLAFSSEYKGIRECKVFSAFLYHLLRIMPFNNACKDIHISIFKYILKLISDSTDLEIDENNISKLFDKHKFGYILAEKHASIDCIYSVCRQILFSGDSK